MWSGFLVECSCRQPQAHAWGRFWFRSSFSLKAIKDKVAIALPITT